MFNTSRTAQLGLRGTTRPFGLAATVLFLACCLIVPSGDAETLKPGQREESLEHVGQAQRPSTDSVDRQGVTVKIPDLVLLDQDGRKVRFYSDLIKDKVIVLSFFYTSCTYICTMQGKVFS